MTRTQLGAALAALSLLAAGCSGPAESQPQPPTPQVTVARPVAQDIVDWDEYVGRFEAAQSVEVRPRATGYLVSAHFRDGQFVREGQLLFTIDARPAQAQLDQARAQLARAQAALANARTALARSRALAAEQAESLEELEARQAALRSAQADVQAAQAAIRARQLDVGFTRVLAPISGRVSERRVDPGNAVTADQTVLTTIVSTDPLHFAFDGSEALLLRYQRQSGGAPTGAPVRVRLQDEADFVRGGRLDFIDNALNTGAGTIRARAVIANPDGFLRPGMVGRARLAAAAPYRALLVPETAIATDAARRVVYLVDGNGVVTPRPVVLGPVLGELRVIRSGLGENDRVVIGGLQRAMPGQRVQPRLVRLPPPPALEAGRSVAAEGAPASSATPAAALQR